MTILTTKIWKKIWIRIDKKYPIGQNWLIMLDNTVFENHHKKDSHEKNCILSLQIYDFHDFFSTKNE